MRLASIDLLRAIAIAFVASAHLLPEAQSLYFKAFAGPLFLLVAGLGFEFYIQSSKDKLEIISRSLILFFLPLLIGAIIFLIISKVGSGIHFNYSFDLFKWNIFQVISLGYLFGLIFQKTYERLILIFMSFFFAYYLSIMNLSTNFNDGVFPFIPWISYFIIGQIAYDYRNIRKPMIFFLLIIGLIPIAFYSPEFISSNRTYIPIVISISSAMLLLLNIFKYIDNFNIIVGLGRITFSSYYFIMAVIIVSKILPEILQHSIKLAICVILFLSVFEIVWRRYNYKYGMEWILRYGSNKLSLIFNKLELFIFKA